ncbi:MAG: WD40 repeat domain-containing protein [Planctomycetota bacterium]
MALAFDHYVHTWDISDVAKATLVNTVKIPRDCGSEVCPISSSMVAWDRQEDYEAFVDIFDSDSGKVVVEFSCADRHCAAIARNEDKGLAVWIEDSRKQRSFRLRTASVATKEILSDLEVPKTGSMERMGCGLAVSHDGTKVALGTSDGAFTLGVADLTAGKVLWYGKNSEAGPQKIAFHPDGESFFISTQNGWVVRYETASGRILSRWGPITFKTTAGFLPRPTATAHARLLAIDVSPDGKYLAVDTEGSHGVIIYDIATGMELKRIRVSQYPIEQALFFSSDSKGIWGAGSSERQLKYFKIVE